MAVVAAAVCLAVTWRRYKWLPAFAFVVLSVLQRYLTHGIHVVAHRVGPPGFLHGDVPLRRVRAHRGVLRADRLLPVA